MLRVGLFILTNLAVLFILNLVLSVFGLEHWLISNGVDFNVKGTLLIALGFGMGGAFISLALSKTMAKRSMQVKIIEQAGNSRELWLLDTVARQAEQSGIRPPEVGIFPSSQPNAFATGMFRNSALLAVSEGLLARMDEGEVEAVLGHEVSHIANGDMITLALLQGVVNAFVIFLARAVAHIIDRVVFKSRGYGPGYFITVIVLQLVFSVLASIIVMWFSRFREFRADRGGAYLAGRDKMIRALQRLQQQGEGRNNLSEEMAAFGICGARKAGIKRLFMTHPPLSERIEALEQLEHVDR